MEQRKTRKSYEALCRPSHRLRITAEKSITRYWTKNAISSSVAIFVVVDLRWKRDFTSLDVSFVARDVCSDRCHNNLVQIASAVLRFDFLFPLSHTPHSPNLSTNSSLILHARSDMTGFFPSPIDQRRSGELLLEYFKIRFLDSLFMESARCRCRASEESYLPYLTLQSSRGLMPRLLEAEPIPSRRMLHEIHSIFIMVSYQLLPLDREAPLQSLIARSTFLVIFFENDLFPTSSPTLPNSSIPL